MVVGGIGKPRVLVHCRRDDDRARIAVLLNEFGADWSPAGSIAELGPLLADDRIDLIVADAEGASPLYSGEARPPLILLGAPKGLADWADLPASVAVLAGPDDRLALGSMIRWGLVLRSRQREAQDEARRRTCLLATISHHLRTPVNEAVLFGHLLQAASRGLIGLADWERLAGGLRSTVETLRELIDDLFEIASFDLGGAEVHEATFPLGPFLEHEFDAIRPLAERKGLAFEVTVDPPDAVVRTDPEKLARALWNLASNAVKFTNEGGVGVSVRAEVGRGLVATVRDTGCGIAAEEQDAIFDEFAQLSNPACDRAQGTGLGLAICRRLVAALRGRLDLASVVGRGSTFTLTLPPETVMAETPEPGRVEAALIEKVGGAL